MLKLRPLLFSFKVREVMSWSNLLMIKSWPGLGTPLGVIEFETKGLSCFILGAGLWSRLPGSSLLPDGFLTRDLT